MNVSIQRIIDKFIGPIIILILTVLKPLKKRPKKIRKIAVVRLWAIGEAILTLPLIKRIKTRYPGAKITVICRSRVKSVFENQKFISKVELLSPKLVFDFNKYDISFDTEPYLNIASIVNFWISKFPMGYNNKISRIINKSSVDFNDKIHAADNFIRLGRAIGVDQKELSSLIELDPGKENKTWAKEYSLKLKKPLLGICPTAGESAKSREWSDGKWIILLKEIHKKYKLTIIFVTSKDNLKFIRALQDQLGFKTYDTTDFSLKQSIALVSKLNLMISIDTGPMHISAAQGVPTIGLFCPNSPTRFGPFGEKNGFVYRPVLSKPCINVHKGQIPDCKNHSHMKNIDVEDVLKEINKLNKKWKILN